METIFGRMLFCGTIVFALFLRLGSPATIGKISPRSGSMGGATRVTLYGTGFSSDQFPFGDGNLHLGNVVTFADAGGSEVTCATHVDGSTETMVQCDTPSGMQENVDYWVRLAVDGVTVPDANYPESNPQHDMVKFTPRSFYTPTITSMASATGRPGTEITFTGRIVTQRYGSDRDVSPNGRAEMITRIYATSLCDPLDGDTLKIQLDSDDSYFGTISCTPEGTFVGNSIVNFHVESPFGRSNPAATAMRTAVDDTSYMFQFYTDVQSVNPSTGSTNGGVVLTVSGDYYETGGDGIQSTYSPARVYVGGTVCEIIDVVKDGDITCTVAAKPTAPPDGKYRGNRGVTVETWDSYTFTDYDGFRDLTTPASNTWHYDDAKYCASDTIGDVDVNKPTRLIGRYVAPHDGSFAFFVKASGATLYVDGVRQAHSSNGYWSSDDKIDLVHNQEYRVVVAARGMSAGQCVETKILYYDTDLISQSSPSVTQEIQTIQLRSQQLLETWTLSFAPSTTKPATKEVQKVCVQGTGSYVTVSLYGVSTEPSAIDAASFKEVLDKLPVLGPGEDFDVQYNDADSCFTVTFNSNRGDFAEFEDNDDTNTITVTQITPGIPDDTSFSFKVGDVISPPLPVADLSHAHIHTAIDTMLGVQCPTRFTTGARLYEGFERGSAAFGPMAVKDREAHCGRYSAHSPNLIYPFGGIDNDLLLYFSPVAHCGRYSAHSSNLIYPIGGIVNDLLLYFSPVMCFAYAGTFRYLKVDYTDPDHVYRRNVMIAEDTFFEDATTWDATSKKFLWRYTCLNFFDKLNAGQPGSLLLHRAWLGSYGDFWIDDLYFGDVSTLDGISNLDDFDVTSLRYGPARLNDNADVPFLIDEFTVSGCDDPLTQCQLEMEPFNCGNDFKQFEIFGNSENVFSVTQTVAASLPLTGTYTLSWTNAPNPNQSIPPSSRTAKIDAQADDDDIQLSLEAVPGIGDIAVSRSATSDCANADIWVTFLNRPGNQPSMQVISDLVAPETRSVAILPHTDGHLTYEPIPADMIFTEDDKPQVVVFINEVPTECAPGADCSFEWSVASTPTVTLITPELGNFGLGDGLLTITGELFSSTAADNEVSIEGILCIVQAPTTPTLITCALGTGPVGQYEVVVNVKGLGLSIYNAVNEFEYTADLESMSPVQGSMAGQNIVTLTGYGFSTSCQVEFYKMPVGDVVCEMVAEPTPTTIQCRVPMADLTSTSDIEKTVKVECSGTYLPTTLTYTYLVSAAPTISEITPAVLAVTGGQEIVITGTNLGDAGSLAINGVDIPIDDHTPTMVVATVPASGLAPINGAPVVLDVDNAGAAVIAGVGIPTIDVKFEIVGITPSHGSLHGGTTVGIAGVGFGTDPSAITATVGGHACQLDSAQTDTFITCTIEHTAAVHSVTNGGTHPVYGLYYAFDVKTLTVYVGDYVHWQWGTPGFVADVNHAVRETVSGTEKTLLEGGIHSGDPTPNGEYVYQFTKAGIHHIWSGYVDVYEARNYRGTITVLARPDTATEVDVSLAGYSALHILSGTSPPALPGSCSYGTDAISSGCTDPIPTAADRFHFIFSQCYTPTVTSIEVTDATTAARSATTNTQLTVTGVGFGEETCALRANIGSSACTCGSISDLSSTTFKCIPATECADVLSLFTYHQVNLHVQNYGNALVDIGSLPERSIALFPLVTSIVPNSGSKRGGTLVTIEGSGLKDITTVTFNGIVASDNVIVSDTELTCVTPSVGTDAPVEVNVADGSRSAVCDPAATEVGTPCKYTFSMDNTPEILTINPNTIDTISNTLVTFTGEKFGTDPAKISVHIGVDDNIECIDVEITSADTEITCKVSGIPGGSNNVVLVVDGVGIASSPSYPLFGSQLLDPPSPGSGSVNGGTVVVVSGHGFYSTTTVTLESTECEIVDGSIHLGGLTFITPPNTAGVYDFAIKSNGIYFPMRTFEYAASATPTVTDISPAAGVSGDLVTLTGTNFGTDSSLIDVTIGTATCDGVNSAADTTVKCMVGDHEKGAFGVVVNVHGLGLSDDSTTFTYSLLANDVSPPSGDSRGGQLLTVNGAGFTGDVSVTVCGDLCVYNSHTDVTLVCVTPAVDAAASSTCDVVIQADGSPDITLSSAYTYTVASAPSIDNIIPARGGTAGGTLLGISGSGFGTDSSAVTIDIAGSLCTVEAHTDTEIQCRTSAHVGTIQSDVIFTLGSIRAAMAPGTAGNSQFYYVNAWSSIYTWDGDPVPVEGEMVVIPHGTTILLDMDTAVLSMLLIQGTMIFDDKDLELRSEIILITDGGELRVGESESKPFCHKAFITLYGHQRSRCIPIYGCKVLGVREGTLNLHGCPIVNTWTRLEGTVEAGGSSITVMEDVSDWNPGDEVIVATTSDRHSQDENEKRTVESAVGHDVTFTEPLQNRHTGIDEQYEGPNGPGDMRTVQFRAEVGLLTRSIVVRGNINEDWEKPIEKCAQGFDTGQFVTQTCFEGRFGEEMGSDQFGVHILFHSPEKHTQKAKGHLSFVEVTHAGQAFRLGRYPIHFHILGDADQSYVWGCAIHRTFNRAINLHGTNHVNIAWNVIYNVMGGALFLEDGVEHGNVFNKNLGVFVIPSSSLLNDDITPAVFWITNGNNVYTGNAAAGGSHFGYWLRMRVKPDGAHANNGICPRNEELGVFSDNTAHSFGRFGFWVFEEFQPQIGSACGNLKDRVKPARFERLIVWNCDKGAEIVNAGALQVIGGVFVGNRLAGFEGKQSKEVRKRDSINGFNVQDTLIVARPNNVLLQHPSQGTTRTGIVMPFGEGFMIINTKFINFDEAGTRALMWTSIQGTCSDHCNGYNIQTERLQFDNVLYRIKFRWGHEGVVEDLDGSLCDTAGPQKITPQFGSAVSNSCPDTCGTFSDNSAVAAAVCSNDKVFHRLAMNNISPQSLKGKSLYITKENGDSTWAPYKDKRLSHKPGWMIILEDQETYILEHENAEEMTNVSFTARFSELPNESACVVIRLKATTRPDRFSIDGGTTAIAETTEDTIVCSNTALGNGDWQYDVDGYVNIAIKGSSSSLRKKRSMTRYDDDIDIDLTFYDCFFDDCIPPPDPDTVPPATSRPEAFGYWHTAYWSLNGDTDIWEGTDKPPANPAPATQPTPGSDVTILKDAWVVINPETTLPTTLGVLRLEGVLEFEYDVPITHAYTLDVEFIIIVGGRLVAGWPDIALPCSLIITLLGSKDSPAYESIHTDAWSTIPGYPIGPKSIAVYGGLDLFGADVGITWTKLKVTADVGDTSLVVTGDASGWVGTIVVTSTNSNPDDTETVTVISATYDPTTDQTTVSISSALAHKHVVCDTPAGSGTEHFAGAVGLITRKILVRGEYHAGDYVGGRVLVSITMATKPDGSIQIHTGYTRINNVAFENMGHEGYTADHDPRYAITILGTGTVSVVKPTKIANASFRDLYNGAIAALGIGSLHITGNVVHKALGYTIVSRSVKTNIENNLISCTLWTGSFAGRNEPENSRYEASIETIGSKGLSLNGNWVSGSQRVGYHVPGEDCNAGSFLYGATARNWGVGNLMGAAVFPGDDLSQVTGQTCSRLQGFNLWANHDYGLYFNNKNTVEATNLVFADNKVAFFAMVVGPSSLGHICEDKTVTLRDSVLIGHTACHDCSSAPSASLTYLLTSSHCRGVSGPNGESIGIVFGQFTQGSNSAPKKPCAGIMSYNSLCGKTIVTGVTIAGFGPHSDCGAAYVISSNEANEDLQHPVEVSENTIVATQIDADFILAYHRPDVGKVNPADCVDMDCDAKKKLLVQDLDGTTLGYRGGAISESEWQWDVAEENIAVDARHGLGDYRTPLVMRTALDGSMIPFSTLREHQGIVRNNDCYTFSGKNFAYWNCPGLTYRMLVIESLDVDTELRRLSPVAVLSERYLDLINGPQDHGWCSGYTCQKRLSTFHALVIPGRDATVYLSSTSPDKTRFFLLNAADTDCLVVSFYYSRTRRIDVYADDGATYVEPTNGEMTDADTPQERFILHNDLTPAEYKPNCMSNVLKWGSPGSNYIHHEYHLMHFILKGKNKVVLKRKNVIIVAIGIPSMTEEEFFGSNMIANIAAILQVTLDKVRVMNVITEEARRRKRATGITVEVEIGSGPKATASEDDPDELTTMASILMDTCQGGSFAYSLGTFGTGATCDSLELDSVVYYPAVPTTLQFVNAISAGHEQAPFPSQPRIRALDQYGQVIAHLGIIDAPWVMTVSLRAGTGHSDASLVGTATVTSVDGEFIFTDLAISHAGNGYNMDFVISGPAMATAMNLTLASGTFGVASVPLTAGVHSMTSGDIIQNSPFALALDLRDSTTDMVMDDITWRGHTFDITCDLPTPLAVGNLTGTLASSFDTSTGRVQFDDLVLSGYGPIYIECHIVSTPAEFDFNYYQQIFVIGESQVSIVRETISNIVVRFSLDFLTTLPTSDDQAILHQIVAQDFVENNPNVIITRSDIYEGSIVILFTIEGGVVDVAATARATCEAIMGGQSYTVGSQTFTLDKYMTVDGQDYYSTTCGAADDEDGLHPGIIALIAILAVLLLAVLNFLVLWKFKVIPRTKTHDVILTQKVRVDSRQGGYYYIDNGKTVYLAGPADKAENIFFNQKSARPNSAAPEATLYGYKKADEAPGLRRSPDPLYMDRALTARSINLRAAPKTLQRSGHM